MNLRSYQIQSVLKTYANKIIRQKEEPPVRDQSRIPVEGKRRRVIEKVAEDIICKITQIGVHHEDTEIKPRQRYNFESQSEADNRFLYNCIDKDNQKKICTFSVKNSSQLIKELNESQIIKTIIDLEL